MHPLEQLLAARKLIADPNKWTQGVLARTAARGRVSPESSYATCWCSLGALHRVTSNTHVDKRVHDLLLKAVWEVEPSFKGFFYEYNDSHTHAEVLGCFDRAIASAGAALET